MRNPQSLGQLTGNGIVWDNHACMPLRPHYVSFLPQLERVHAAGVNVLTLNVAYGTEATTSSTLAMLATFRQWVEAHAR